MKNIFLILILIFTSSCSKFALLSSGTSLAISQKSYTKVYSGIDVLTYSSTGKSIKAHAFNKKERDHDK
jgi:hypothetical protein